MDAILAELDYDYAASLAARAMRALAEQQIPATPDNFSIWFHYFLGAPPELRHAIDALVDNHRPFDATPNHDLFVAYLEPRAEFGAVEILPTITVSIGVAQFRPGESMADLIERCDRALDLAKNSLAKNSGRNRVIAESELDRHELAAG